MTCTNTEKQLFTVDYTLSVPNNALERRAHRMGARYGDHPRGGEGTPTCVWPMHMHVGVVCYLNKKRMSLTWHVPHKSHTRAGTSRTGAFVPETESSVGDPVTERA